jgi:hypothetical protein
MNAHSRAKIPLFGGGAIDGSLDGVFMKRRHVCKMQISVASIRRRPQETRALSRHYSRRASSKWMNAKRLLAAAVGHTKCNLTASPGCATPAG